MVGSGVAGLTAAYVLRRSADVTLYEAASRLGGHADTHTVLAPDGRELSIDTGFIVHNERTYPTLLRLFAELGVRTQETDMSMSVRCDGCGLEYSGGQGLAGLLPRASTVLNWRFDRMLLEILRFHRQARAVLAGAGPASAESSPSAQPLADDVTMAEFLRRGNYSDYFRAHFVVPLIAAVWSCAADTALQYPARYLFAFLDNHGMLSVSGSPKWRTVVGGSARYVELAVKELEAVRVGVPVRSVARVAGGVEIADAAGATAAYDAVVIATHPDQALRLLPAPTTMERSVLGAFRYSVNPAMLHTDSSVMPTAPRAAASWNYRMPGCSGGADAVQVTYDMTRLMRLGVPERYLVSLNAPEVPADSVIDRMDYEHPQYTPESVAAQKLLPELNDGTVAFAGAYHGWGFHEDGARSGLHAAQSLGASW
ncbi:NAD(P)/FAD-dependent oxidoreductase [Kineosporia succinea]|uniref:NAD/FAD-binding protein n=1 Tax=Kineosporia succinea TaxID=84632 RepID=A0ABT9P3I7_9ACTN|nr:FAD-dependent oxidoreductase [Kineosporia succinea]MDP9827243.1 putative NAD/FAD-binding protein [Kineosporia succinea]